MNFCVVVRGSVLGMDNMNVNQSHITALADFIVVSENREELSGDLAGFQTNKKKIIPVR